MQFTWTPLQVRGSIQETNMTIEFGTRYNFRQFISVLWRKIQKNSMWVHILYKNSQNLWLNIRFVMEIGNQRQIYGQKKKKKSGSVVEMSELKSQSWKEFNQKVDMGKVSVGTLEPLELITESHGAFREPRGLSLVTETSHVTPIICTSALTSWVNRDFLLLPFCSILN